MPLITERLSEIFEAYYLTEDTKNFEINISYMILMEILTIMPAFVQFKEWTEVAPHGSSPNYEASFFLQQRTLQHIPQDGGINPLKWIYNPFKSI